MLNELSFFDRNKQRLNGSIENVLMKHNMQKSDEAQSYYIEVNNEANAFKFLEKLCNDLKQL